jgi:peptide/nickel transport system permease protein
MTSYILKRLISGIIVLFLFVSAIFFAVQIFLPGDYASQFALGLSQKEIEELRVNLGLDLPIWQRYLNWLSNVLRGDLGYSFSSFDQGPPVIEIIKSALPATLFVFGIGTALAFMIGFWLGKATAWRGPGFLSSSITFASITLYTSFPPWLAFVLIYFLFYRFMGLRTISTSARGGLFSPIRYDQGPMMLRMLALLLIITIVILIVNRLIRASLKLRIPGLIIFLLVIGLWVGSWYALGIDENAMTIMEAASLPIVTFTLLSFGEIMLIMRTTMMDTLHEDYILTARAKGLPESQIRDRHAARNALLPVMTRMIVTFPFLLTGAVMVEQVLAWSGMGTTLFLAVGTQNITLTVGMLLVIGIFSLVLRLMLDIMHALLDPRIRSGRQEVRLGE